MSEPAGPPRLMAVPDELAVWTSYLLRQVALRAQDEVARVLAPLGLRGPHYAVMQMIGVEARSQAALSAQLQTDRTTMVAIVDDLERWRLAERRRHPTDRRAHEVTLTADGADVLARARGALAAADDALLADFDALAREQLRAALGRLIRTFDRRREAASGGDQI